MIRSFDDFQYINGKNAIVVYWKEAKINHRTRHCTATIKGGILKGYISGNEDEWHMDINEIENRTVKGDPKLNPSAGTITLQLTGGESSSVLN